MASAAEPLATYEDLDYRDVFWRSRRYEDGCDRLALRALLPPAGECLIEVGAGFGRLAGEYSAFREVVLLDASEIHVAAARESLGGDPRISVIAGDALALPFPDGQFDAAVCVRVLHHFEDPRPLVTELARVVRPGGVVVLEFANRRNLKALARYLLRRQKWSPFGHGSVSYRPFHYDHAPLDVRRAFYASGMRIQKTRAASMLRLPVLARRLPLPLLLGIERLLQAPLGAVTPSPSVFVLARKVESADGEPADGDRTP